MKLTFDLQRFDEVTILAGDTYMLDGVTYTALEDARLNIGDDGKVSGIASGSVSAVVTGRSNPVATVDATNSSTEFTLTGKGAVLTLTKVLPFELDNGTFTLAGNVLTAAKGSDLRIGTGRTYADGTIVFGHDYADTDITYTITDTTLTEETEKGTIVFTASLGEQARSITTFVSGKIINGVADGKFTGGFTITKGSSMGLVLGNYTVKATANADATSRIFVDSKGINIIPGSGDGSLNVALSRGDTEIISGELNVTSGKITFGYDNAITFDKDTSFNFKQGDYVLTATTTDAATIGIALQDNKLVFTPGQNDGGLNLLLRRGGTPVFAGELNVTDGTITFDPTTQKFSFTDGTNVSIALPTGQEFGFKVTGGDASIKVESDGAGNFVLTPDNGDGSLDITLKQDGQTTFYNNISVSGGSILIGNMGQVIGLTKGTTANVTLGNYTLSATATDDASFTLGIANDGSISITPAKNDGALDIAIKRDGTTIFSNTVSVDGTITFNPTTQAMTLTDGTTVTLTFGDYELTAKANGNAASVLSLTGNGIEIKPNSGDGSLDLTLSGANGTLNANLEVLSGSFVLGEGGTVTVTKGTELKIDFGDGYVVNFKATDDAGGSLALGANGITFKPGSDDGGLELSITRDGQTRTASLDVTGSVTYKLDGSISLAKGTVVRNVFDSGRIVTITANTDASGSMVFTPDGGLTITPATPDALTLSVTTASGLNGNFNEITGTVTYKGGSLILADGTSFVGTYDAQTSTGGTTFKSEGGDGIIIPTDDGFAIISEDGAKVSVVNERNHGCFVNDGKATFYLTTLQYSISEGSNVEISNLRFTSVLETAGSYTLNGMKITTTADNVEVMLTDYDTVAFAADAPVKVSTIEGGKLFMVAQSDGMIQATTKATNNVEVTSGSITFDPATQKFSCTAGTTVSFTRGEQIINFTADKDISATHKIEEDVHYFMLDDGAAANLSISSGGQTIFAGDLQMGGVVSYRPSTGTFGLTGANSSHGDGTNTFANLTLTGRTSGSTYDIRAATHDTTVVFVPDLIDGKLEINFPNERKHALQFTFSKDGQTLVNNDLAIDGKVGLDFATREVYMTKGTTVDLNAGDFSATFTATDDAGVKLSVDDGKILLTPKDGDGSLDFAIKRGDEITFAGNLSISGGSIVLEPANETVGLTKSTTLTLTPEKGKDALKITALDDASGQLSFVDGGIRFAPNAGDGKLELNFVSAGRKATLDVTGAVVYGGDGKISLEDGTVADLTWTDGVNLKMTSHGSTGSVTLDADKGIKITSDDENLDIALTTPAGVQTNISGIKGTLYYNAGTVSFDDNSTITATTTLGGQPIFTTLETIGGTGHISFVDNGTVYAADTGAMRITWSRDGRESTFTVNSGTIHIGHGIFQIAEGTDLSTDLKDFVPALYFTTSEAGTYTLNGQKITTTTADIPITATDDMMTFNLRGSEISVDDMTFTGNGDVIITADAVTVGNGVEVAGLGQGNSFVLTEAGNVTVDNRIFELTEDVPTGITVTGDSYGFEFARTLTKESEERLGIKNSTDIGKIFTERFSAADDDSYRVQTDLLGLQQIIGITAPVTVNASASVADDPEETIFDIVTDSAGVIQIGNKPYTISGDSSVVVKADFEPGKSYVRGFDGLSGTVSGNFTPHAVSLDGGDPIIVHGDRSIEIANGAGGAEIFNLSKGSTLEALGGVSKVHTDTAGKFQFGNTADDSLGVTIRGDDNVTFEFNSDQELTAVSNLEGSLIFDCMSDKLIINGTGVTIDGEISSVGAYNNLLYLHDATDGTTITTAAVDKTWAQMRGASMAVNDNTFTLAEDDDGIWIRNKEIFGLDEGASLQVTETGNYVVNGETLTVGASDIVVGLGDAGTYVYDAANPLLTRKSTATDIIDKFKPENVTVVGADDGGTHNVTMTGGDLAVVEKTAARVNITAGDDTVVSQGKNVHVNLTDGNTWLFATGGKMTLEGYDATTGTGFGTNYLDIAAAIQSGSIAFDDGELSIGAATVDLGKRSEIVDFYDRSGALQAVGFASDSAEFDAGDATQNLIIVGGDYSTLRGGTGDDTIFAAEGSFVDAGGGYNVINLPETRNGLPGVTVSLSGGGNDTIENFSAGFDATNDRISFEVTDVVNFFFDGSNATINNEDGTSGVLKNVADDAPFVNILTADEETETKVAIAKDDAVITAGDELADVYYGYNSGVDFTGYGGALFVNLGSETSITGGDDILFIGINSVTAGKGSATIIGSDGGETLTAGTAGTGIWGGAGDDLLRGNTSDAKGGSTKFYFTAGDGHDTITDFEFYDGTNLATADKINVGTDEVTSVVTDGAGNVRLQLNHGDDWLTLAAAQGKDFRINDLTAKVDANSIAYDADANCFVATGLNATMTVDEHAAIWLGDGQTGAHGIYYLGDIAVLDASKSADTNILAGNDLDNTILAGDGGSSLWGGNLGDDLLIGGAGKDNFFYAFGNGSDTIGATDGDVINLAGVTLNEIISTEIAQGSVTLNFADGGRLNVEGSTAVEFALSGEKYFADHNSNTWVRK